MKLKSFSAKGVYGYLDFKIDFNPDLTFLVGVNGSGKTTILRLTQALLTPAFRDLLTLPYLHASIVYEDKCKTFEIVAEKTDGKLKLRVSSIESELSMPTIGEDELDYLLSRESPGGDLFEEYQRKYSDHEVFQFISKIDAPVVLGLERTHRTAPPAARDFYFEGERILSNKARRGLRARRVVQGSLAAGLMETQVLVQDTYRRLRRIEDEYSQRLRETIMLSAFQYSDFSFPAENAESLLPDWAEQRKIRQRKGEIETALSNIGVSGDNIKMVLERFFMRLEDLFQSIGRMEKPSINIEWVINKAQIDRVSELIRIIDSHKSKVDKLFSPINTFIKNVNSFYEDSEKSLSIDTVGQLAILRPDGAMASIDALSSGERQLLIIFAHLLFNEYGNRSNVFIIDEPELSLHLRWQERFVENALEVSPNTQLILATHSPEIVGGYDKKAITVRNKRNSG